MTGRHKSPRTIVLLLLAVIPACTLYRCTSDARITDGNSSETTNVAVVTHDNRPAAYATVKRIDARNWAALVSGGQSPVIDSASADGNGVCTFDSSLDREYNLQIDHEQSGILIRSLSSHAHSSHPGSQSSPKPIKLKAYASLSGYITTDTLDPRVLSLEGTAYKDTITDCQFTMNNIAPGAYRVMVEAKERTLTAGSMVTLASADSVNKDMMVTFSRLMLDDFSDGDSLTILGEITGGFWYGFSDGIEGGSSQVSWEIARDQSADHALHADIILSPESSAWAGVGAGLGQSGSQWDLSGMNALHFRARGVGTIRVNVESMIGDSLGIWPDYGTLIELDSA
ncbi:MAG: hypothetical protein ACOCW2_04935, partial [Chitinivibrionales bacterium]